MNINNFFKTLEYLQEEFIPKNNYPKNAIFSNTYKDLDYVLSNNLLKSCNDKYLVFYKENNVLDCIGIDQELNYINKLNSIKIEIPCSLKRDLNKNRNQINAIISIDLNNLKIINDTLGHYEGDKAILTLVELIKEIILKDMCLYRVGGDEFLIVCYNTNKLEIEEFVKKLKERMNETKYSCAIGVAYKEKNLSLNDLTKIADEAMYEDKKHYKKVR